MFITLQTPVIIGHRGASMHAPENTLASFELALAHKADAIEFDVKLTADKEVVVIHDPTVDRTTNGTGRVAQLTLKEIKKLDAGGWFDKKFQGQSIPTLAEVFERVGKLIPMNIELTNYTTPRDELVARVVDLIQRMAMEDRVFFSSFLSKNLNLARALLPDCGIGYLMYTGTVGTLQRVFQPVPRQIDSINPYYLDVTREMVNRAHQLNRRVLTYTVNSGGTLKKLLAIGVDGIFTDDPLMGKQIARESSG